ncbi:class I SAM-dependent methyltransferase [Paraburkholderia mimosarum]|uniref:class I SAM-dependent methyltransferase n=1 Tax=Paraburkholderia mimosarum TaxID=312026 RepID=UPI00138DE9E2|nr:class I SAM-dependent methyltransferase [Paraburkholderia mimosarum]
MGYIIKTDDSARLRLGIQSRLYEQSSFDLISRAGTLRGRKILEVGCGSGAMTLHLARAAGPQGTVTAIDNSPAQLDASRELVTENGFENVNFFEGDINCLDHLDNLYDLVYCRMVLHHVADADHAIREMVRSVCPDGYLLCEEPVIHDGSFCFPPSEAIDEFIRILRSCFSVNGRDYNIAFRMESVIRNLGLQIEHSRLHHPLLNSRQDKLLYAMSLSDLAPQMIKNGIVDPSSASELHEKLVHLSNSETTMTWARMHSVLARKSNGTERHYSKA